MNCFLKEEELKKAELLRELIGGCENSPVNLDGDVDGYRSISTESGAWCVICAKFMKPASEELGSLFFRVMKERAENVLHDVNVEVASDMSGMIITVLHAQNKGLLNNATIRQFVREIGVQLERVYGVETRIGAGGVCETCGYIGFSKSEAIHNMTRYNVSKTIQNILVYVSINYSNPDLTNGQIAKDNFLNYAYLCNRFKQEMGITLNHYIQEVRMRTAADLLTLPNRNVLEIARMVGYTDVKYFSKCFKLNFGMTPNQYRTLNKKER